MAVACRHRVQCNYTGKGDEVGGDSWTLHDNSFP